MIISASRRTDIPAFYSNWFVNRLREGFFLTPNPRNHKSVGKLSCSPQAIDCIVFWSKNPAPMADAFALIDNLGYKYYLQFSLTPYGRDIETNLPDKETLIATFRRIGEKIGAERLVWRYDPIIVSGRFPPERHIEAFRRLAGTLSGCTQKCVISFIDFYAKINKNIKEFNFNQTTLSVMRSVVRELSLIAKENGLRLFVCSEAEDFSSCGVSPASCIDGEIIEKLTGRPLKAPKDPGQRPLCNCLASVDIGMYDSCVHGCVYCYANINQAAALKNAARHDPAAPLLFGAPHPGAAIKEKTPENMADSPPKDRRLTMV
ncbi:MAG: DUF1848 domain-containing protein [Acidaminococcales bacterium]|jgi:hypothetical protein|nr:DUF1848 domain-containing protein [Acidaminococcales bacterium]